MEILCILLIVYWVILILRAVYSWVEMAGRIPYASPIRKVGELLKALTDPVVRPVSRLVPPVHVGGIGFDLGFLIVIVAVGILQQVVCSAG